MVFICVRHELLELVINLPGLRFSILSVLLVLSACFRAVACASCSGTSSSDPQYSVSVTGSVWGTQQLPITVEPGTMNNPFTVYLTNFGSIPAQTAQNITITLSLQDPFSASGHPGNVSNSMPKLLPTATLPTTFYLDIAPTSNTGIYTLPTYVEYSQNGTSFAFTTSVQLPVTTLADLTVQNAFWGSPSSPALVGPGTSYGSLILNVKNVGDNNAYDTNVTIHLSQPFYYNADGLEIEEMAELGVIPAGSIVPATFTVSVESNVSIGEYPLNVTLYYNDGIVHGQTVQVPVLGSANIVEQSYAVTQGNIYPGDNNVVLNVYLVNSGNLTVNNVQVQLLIPSPLLPAHSGSDRVTLGIMPPGQPMLATFLFNVPSSTSSPLNLDFPLQIKYGSHELMYYLPLTISGISSFTQSANSVPTLDQGSSNVGISLSITNIGNSTAKYVNAQLLLPNQLSGTTFTFLGNVAPKASNLATFALDVSSNAASGTYHSTLRITWLQDDAPGRQFSQDLPVDFQVQQSPLSSVASALGANSVYIAVIVVVAIVVILGVRAIVSRRKK
jgi:hypothetical protein